ncbi:MAG: helix-turn-helix domain-containing protein [Bacteroidota bacterium]
MHQNELIDLLKNRRISLQITQEHLAELAEVALRTVKAIESGKGNPTLETVVKIADVLGMELNFTIKTGDE